MDGLKWKQSSLAECFVVDACQLTGTRDDKRVIDAAVRLQNLRNITSGRFLVMPTGWMRCPILVTLLRWFFEKENQGRTREANIYPSHSGFQFLECVTRAPRQGIATSNSEP